MIFYVLHIILYKFFKYKKAQSFHALKKHAMVMQDLYSNLYIKKYWFIYTI